MAYVFTIGSLEPLREQYQPIAIGDIGTVTDEEWAEHWREHGSGWRDPRPENVCYLKRAYGGSDMGIISDTSNFEPKLQLWASKAGIKKVIKKRFKSNTDALEIGHMYETVTAQKYHALMRREGKRKLKVLVEGFIIGEDGKYVTDKNGNRVSNRISMYMYRDGRKNPDGSFTYPWALANCDAFVIDDGIQGGLEIKTTSFLFNSATIKNEWQKGIIPVYYLYQIVYYMGILNLQFWDICCSWGQGFNDCAVIRFYRDYSLEKQVFDMVSEFDSFVESRIQPDASTCQGSLVNDYYYELFGPVDKTVPLVELPESIRPVVVKAMEIDKDLENLEEEKKSLTAEREKVFSQLYPMMKNSSYAQFRLDPQKIVGITLDTPTKKGKFDLERFEKDHPELITMYQKFDATAFGKADRKLKAQYMLPSGPDLENKDKHPSFSISVLDRPEKAS